MPKILRVDRTDYTLSNTADDPSRDKDVLCHDCERWWVCRTMVKFSIDLSRLAKLLCIIYGEVSETSKSVSDWGRRRRRRQQEHSPRGGGWLVDLITFESLLARIP